MPASRASQVCHVAGCPELRPCSQHPTTRRARLPLPFYDTPAWRRLRAQVMREETQCRVCGAPSTDADHILDMRSRPDLALVRSNLRGLCHRCHSARTRRDMNKRNTQ